tara:strand:+ start:140 stop:346 length:207 start_codon:yes stop_codon:yes gene_type:complete
MTTFTPVRVITNAKTLFEDADGKVKLFDSPEEADRFCGHMLHTTIYTPRNLYIVQMSTASFAIEIVRS